MPSAVHRPLLRSSAGPRSAGTARPDHPQKSCKDFHPCGRNPSSGVTVKLLAWLSKSVCDPEASGDLFCGVRIQHRSTSLLKFGREVPNVSCVTQRLICLKSLPALLPPVSDGRAEISYCAGAGQVLAQSSPMGLCLQKPLLIRESAADALGILMR